MHRNTPRRSMSRMRSHLASVRSAAGVTGCSTPALLKPKSSRPKVSIVMSSPAFTSAARVTSHLTASARPPQCLDHSGGLLIALFRDIGGDDIGALASECQRGGAADAIGGPGHKGDLPSKTPILA